MQHVFVETNWVVDVAAPKHRQRPVARGLLDRAARGELMMHIPSICFVEARKAILNKFQPQNVDAIRDFLGRAREDGDVTEDDAQGTYRVLERFRSSVRGELSDLDETLAKLRRSANLDVFGLSERMLQISVDLSFGELGLAPFDQSILAAVLGRTEELSQEPGSRFAFCERDKDLQPWDKNRDDKEPLASIYTWHRIRVYGDFDMTWSWP